MIYRLWVAVVYAACGVAAVVWWMWDVVSWPWRMARARSCDRAADLYEREADRMRRVGIVTGLADRLECAAMLRRERAARYRRRPLW